MAIQDITKPMALDETLQATNSILGQIRDAMGNQDIIGDTDISEIADGTLTGAVAQFDEDINGLDTDKADKVTGATSGDLAGLDPNGNLTDAGWSSDKTTTSATGNPISISGLKSNQLAVNPIITFEPIQAGSGTPSPSNIRVISGYNTVEIISANGSDPTAQGYVKTTDLSLALGQTIYGGSLDVRTGKLVSILKALDMSTMNWQYSSGLQIFYCYVPDIAQSNPIWCSCYNPSVQPITENYTITSRYGYYVENPAIVLKDTRYTDATSLKNALTGQTVVYTAIESVRTTIQLTPHEIILLKDYAYVSTNGTTITLDYHNGEMASLEDVSQLGETVNELGNNIKNARELFTYTFNGSTTWQSALYDISQKLKLLSWADMRRLQLQYDTDRRIFNIVKINDSNWQFSTTCLDGTSYIDTFVAVLDAINLSGNKFIMIRVQDDSSVHYTPGTTNTPSNGTVIKVLLS